MEDLEQLASLIKRRNSLEDEITAIIQRPAEIGHIGEYISSRIFHIALERSATHKGSDGHFTEGLLQGNSVNIKWYAKNEGILDINPNAIPDHFLVLVGPKSAAQSSRGRSRPWVIQSVLLFDAPVLLSKIRARKIKIGVATSVFRQLWEEAEIYPEQRNKKIVLSDEQRSALGLFR